VHRDIKPSNIVFADVMGKRTAKILDFGIAKVMHEAWSVTSAKTSRVDGGGGMFTPAYAAPEQWVTRFGATGPWTDVFALALVFVELMTGKPALEGPTIPQFLGQCIDEDHRPTPRTLGADVPDGVEAVFAKALEVEPADRYPDVGALLAALNEAAAEVRSDGAGALDWSSGPTTTIYGAPLSERGDRAPRARKPTLPRRPRRVPRAAWLALPVLVLGLVVVAYLQLGAGDAEVIRAKAPEGALSAALAPPLPPETGEPNGAWLTVLCTPFCSDIVVDGESLGPSPVLASRIQAGRREIVMRREGTPERRMEVRVEQGAERSISVSMGP
jgi:hypothetical protein